MDVALSTTATELGALMVFSSFPGHWHITGQRIDLTRRSSKTIEIADQPNIAAFVDFC